ncbi:MAG: protein kinase domain-containing protein [Verrucomicrobiales bacterium]
MSAPRPASDATLRIEAGQHSIAGAKSRNDDCCGVRAPSGTPLRHKGIAAVIADGVSAASFGKEAGEMCVQGFLSDYYSTPDTWTAKTSAQRVLDGLNRWLYSQSHHAGLHQEKGYVSTLSALILRSRTAHLFHIGDTRIYRLRDRRITQLTHDHSSLLSPGTSQLTRAMGLDLHLQVDYHECALAPGDHFILSSDGVHEWLPEKSLVEFITSEPDLDQAARRIVTQAHHAGSPDNLTCLLIRIDALPPAGFQENQRTLTTLPFPPLLTPGARLDGLEVTDILTESARSQLYRVRDPASGRNLVMKTPSPKFSDDPAYIERFATEEWIGKRVSHPNLIQVIERETPATRLYYLMEAPEAHDLTRWLKNQHPRPAIADVLRIIDQTISGVRALHRRETLHQDLKPENILIDSAGHITVIDYGSCRIAGLRECRGAIDAPHPGTLEFSAPEYRLPALGDVSPRADLFAIAAIAYHLLSGGKSPYGEAWSKATSPRDFAALRYQSVATHHPMVPPWMDAALAKALRLKPAERQAALSEFMHDLTKPNSALLPPSAKPLLERNPLLFWQILCAALALLSLILALT